MVTARPALIAAGAMDNGLTVWGVAVGMSGVVTVVLHLQKVIIHGFTEGEGERERENKM